MKRHMISCGRSLAILAALVLLAFSRSAAEPLPEKGSKKGIDWRPSGQPGIVYARFDPKSVEIPVTLAELEREMNKVDAVHALLARWLLHQREMSGARWDATLRTYYPDSETGSFGDPYDRLELPLDEETSITITQDELVPWYARITATGDKVPPRSLSRPFVYRVTKDEVTEPREQARQLMESPHILPEELRPRVTKMSRAEFRAALVASKELEPAGFMRMHKAYAALAKEGPNPDDIYPKGIPPIPSTRPVVPSNAKTEPNPVLDVPQPSTSLGGLGVGAIVAAALVLVVLAMSVFWRRSG